MTIRIEYGVLQKDTIVRKLKGVELLFIFHFFPKATLVPQGNPNPKDR